MLLCTLLKCFPRFLTATSSLTYGVAFDTPLFQEEKKEMAKLELTPTNNHKSLNPYGISLFIQYFKMFMVEILIAMLIYALKSLPKSDILQSRVQLLTKQIA